MVETYMTKKGWPLHISSIEDISLKKITSEFNLTKKSVRTEFTLPRIAFIGNFDTLSITCQRELAKNLGFEYMEEIPFGTFSSEQIQFLGNKWPDITKDFTKLIVLGNPCIVSKEDGLIELNLEAENDLLKTYKRDKKPVYLKYKIPVTLESEIIRLHSEYPVINNNTSWKNEPSLRHPKPYDERLSNFNNSNKNTRNDGIQFGYNCRYLVPQHSKCEKFAQERLSERRLSKQEWMDINKAILYSRILNFDLIDKIKSGDVKIKRKTKKGSIQFLIEAAFEYDDCSLNDGGGQCIHFNSHNGFKIECLMDDASIKNHPNYNRYIIKKEEINNVKKTIANSMVQDTLFES